MIPSQNAKDLIKKYESCRLEAYQDQGGRWTIGWGTTGPGIQEGLTISQATADSLFIGHVNDVGYQLSELVNFLLNQNQFDACTSFVYNLGVGNFTSSTLLKLIKARQYALAAEEFPKWDHVNGVVVPGLLNRRLAEKALFLTPLPTIS